MSPKSKTRRGRKPYRPPSADRPKKTAEPVREPRRGEKVLRSASFAIAVFSGGLVALSGLTAVMDMNATLMLNTLFTAIAFAIAGAMVAKSVNVRRVKLTACLTGVVGALLIASLMHPLLQAAAMPLTALAAVAGSIHVRLRVLHAQT